MMPDKASLVHIGGNTGLVGWSGLLGGEFSESAHSPFATPHSATTPTPPPPPSDNSLGGLLGSSPTPNKLKRFTNNDSAYTMVQTSKGLKFRCNACSRIFNLKCTLLRHVRHQHQGRFVPHPCPQCGQVFKRTDHLKVHMKKIHNIAPVSKASSGSNGGGKMDSGTPPPSGVGLLATSSPPPLSSQIEPQMVVDYEEPRDLSSSSSRLREDAPGSSSSSSNHLVPPSPLLFNTQAKAH